MKKKIGTGVIIGLIIATIAVTIYYQLQVNELKKYYETKYPEK